MNLSRTTFVILLLTTAFLVRFGVVCALRDLHTGPTGPPSNDDVQFNTLAINLAHGDGFVNVHGRPTSFRAPGFSFFLAGLYVLAGVNYPLAYAALSLLGAVACVFTYLIGRELLSEGAARVAGLLAAVYFPHVFFATTFTSENLFVPSLALGIWLLLRHLRNGSAATLALAGLALGWATLTRPFGLLLLPLLLAVLAVPALRQRRLPLVPILTFTTCFLAVILPWTARNYAVHAKPVLIATNGGSTFYGGNNDRVVSEPRQYGHWISTTELPHRDLIDAQPDEVTHDQMEWRLGVQWLRDNPAALPKLCLFKFARLWYLADFEAGHPYYYTVRVATYVPFLLLFGLGMLRCLVRPAYWTAPWLVLHGTFAATVLTALVFWGSPRFRDANAPLLMVYTVVGAQALAVRRSLPVETAQA